MTIIILGEQAVSIKNMLADVGVTDIIEKHLSPVERIKAIMESAKGKDLFKDVKDPSEWQREIRKEWYRDFDTIRS